jgi:hypothetical protein
MLFGEDLAKQVCDAKETNTAIKNLENYRPQYRQDNRSSNSQPQRGGYSDYRTENNRPHFLGKGQKKPNFRAKPGSKF